MSGIDTLPTFFIPGDVLASVGTYGGGAPETGYYQATIGKIAAHPTRPTSRKMELTFDGFTTHEWMNSPFDAKGNQLPGLSENQVLGMVKGIKTVFVSAGYTNEDMTNGSTDEWLPGRACFVEWHSAKDLGGRYGKVETYITQARFKEYQAAGKVPGIAAQASEAGSSGPAPVAPSNGATLPVTVAPAPSSPRLPPPPGAESVVR